jgi:uncharacterized membrane protein
MVFASPSPARDPEATASRSRGPAVEASFTGITAEYGLAAFGRNSAFVALVSVIAVLTGVLLVLLGCNLVRRYRRRRPELREEIPDEDEGSNDTES